MSVNETQNVIVSELFFIFIVPAIISAILSFYYALKSKYFLNFKNKIHEDKKLSIYFIRALIFAVIAIVIGYIMINDIEKSIILLDNNNG